MLRYDRPHWVRRWKAKEMTAPVHEAQKLPDLTYTDRDLGKSFGNTVRDRWKVWLARPLLAFIVFAAWEWSSGRLMDEFFISRPSQIFAQIWEWTSSGEIFFHMWITLQELSIGFVIGALLGVIAGIVIGLLPFVSDVVRPFVIAVNAVPSIALMPLFIIWFGLGILPKVILALTSVFFFVFFTTFSGVQNVNRDLMNVVLIMGGKRRDIIQRVILPATAGWVFAGLRISLPHAFTGAVAGELLAGNKGMGSLIRGSAGVFNIAGVFAGVVSLIIFAWIMSILLDMVEARMGRWTTATEVTRN